MTGIFRKTRCLALIIPILCLAVATAAAPAQITAANGTSNCTKVGIATVCPGFNTVKVSFTTPTKTTASVSTSVDKSFALTVLDQRAKKTHNITIPEPPAKTYNLKVTATPAKGKSSTWIGSFATGVIGSVPAMISSKGNKFLVNGMPLGLIAVEGYECATPDYVKDVISMGANILEKGVAAPSCDTATLHGALNNQVWWYSNDPSDQQQPSTLGELLQEGSTDLTAVADPGSLLGCASKSDLGLYQLVKKKASEGPVISTIVVTQKLDASDDNCIDPVRLNSLFWTTFAAGGSGVGYYVRSGVPGNFSVVPSLPAMAVKDANELTTLEPCILNGKSLPVKTDLNGPVKISAWQYAGMICVIAANTRNAPVQGTFSLNSKAKTAQVLWAARSVRMNAGSISESFAPLAVNIYKLLPPVATAAKK